MDSCRKLKTGKIKCLSRKGTILLCICPVCRHKKTYSTCSHVLLKFFTSIWYQPCHTDSKDLWGMEQMTKSSATLAQTCFQIQTSASTITTSLAVPQKNAHMWDMSTGLHQKVSTGYGSKPCCHCFFHTKMAGIYRCSFPQTLHNNDENNNIHNHINNKNNNNSDNLLLSLSLAYLRLLEKQNTMIIRRITNIQ